MTMLRKRVLAVIEDGNVMSADEIQQAVVDRMVSSVTVKGVEFALSRLISMGRVDKFIIDGRVLYQIAEVADGD